jgi:selenocysteine lyase/cysteine desulfurase
MRFFMAAFPIDEVRSKFPGLQRMVDGRQAIFFDGPGGSQSPDSVGDAVRHYLLHQNANVGMSFATSVETNRLIDDALRACADFVGCEDQATVVIGNTQNLS